MISESLFDRCETGLSHLTRRIDTSVCGRGFTRVGISSKNIHFLEPYKHTNNMYKWRKVVD